jgi:hypothetical protein
MTGIGTISTSSLTPKEQQGATTAAKKREEDAITKAQVIVATTQRGQEALLTVVIATRKTLDEACAHERVATLTCEKEEINTRFLE